MKMKMRLGEGGLKGFFLRHAEKVIFGVVLLLVAVFVYSSATQEGISMSETPEKLKSEASLARTHVTTDHWEKLAPERVIQVQDFPARAEEIRTPIRDDPYTPETPLNKGDLPSQKPRRDPVMLPPIKVEAKGGEFAVAWRVRKPENAYELDKDAVLKPSEDAKPKKKPKRDRRRPGSEYDMYGEGMYGSSGPGYGSSGPGYGSSGPGYGSSGPGYGSEDMYGVADPYAMPTTESTPGYGGSGMAAGLRKVGNTYIEQYVQGFRGAMQSGPAALVVPRSFAIVSVTALVPYEKQWAEFERALADARGYSAAQDIPKYIMYMAERAEISDDPDAPLQWKPISNTSFVGNQLLQYAGIPKEVADETYLMPGILTMPIPPILLKSYDELALHSEIPRAPVRVPMAPLPGQLLPEEGSPEADPANSANLEQGLPQLPRVGPGMQPYGMTPGMTPGYGPGYGGETGYGAGYGTESGYGSESGYNTYGPGGLRQPMVKHKMVRFFDLTAEAGRSYRYRVCVLLEDPNRPRDPKADPNRRILDPTVVERLEKVEASDQEYLTRTGKPRQGGRTFYIQTDWSDPSPVVTVQSNQNFLAGETSRPRFIKLSTKPGEAGPEVQIGEANGKLVTVAWDRSRAVEVPSERDVRRGSYLTFTEDADVLHPQTLQVKTIEKFSFDTGAFVADIRGGDDLITDTDAKTQEKTTLSVPGEFLVFDGRGNMKVCDEIDQIEEYRRLMLIEGSGQPAAMMPGYSDPYGGGYGDPYGGSGYGEGGGYFSEGGAGMYGTGT